MALQRGKWTYERRPEASISEQMEKLSLGGLRVVIEEAGRQAELDEEIEGQEFIESMVQLQVTAELELERRIFRILWLDVNKV